MPFSALHLLGGVLIGVAAIKTSGIEPHWFWLFVLGSTLALLGSLLEFNARR